MSVASNGVNRDTSKYLITVYIFPLIISIKLKAQDSNYLLPGDKVIINNYEYTTIVVEAEPTNTTVIAMTFSNEQ